MKAVKVIKDIEGLRLFLKDKKEIGFVPTMGNLHKGHLSLVRESNKRDNITIVSIFVNPAQFGPKEDFNNYPRTLEQDLERLGTLKVDAVFYPAAETMFNDQAVYVNEDKLSKTLCGNSRPGHFKGVLTIVLKFFNIIRPHRAYFGRKDYLQFILIDKMVKDLNLDINIISCPIVREENGLAMSSRNLYLNLNEHKSALLLSKSLRAVNMAFKDGTTSSEILKDIAAEVMKSIRVQYIEIVSPKTLLDKHIVNKDDVILIAAFVGSTRLIDNTIIGDDNL